MKVFLIFMVGLTIGWLSAIYSSTPNEKVRANLAELVQSLSR